MSSSSSSTLNQLLTAPPNYRLKESVYSSTSSSSSASGPTPTSQQPQINTPPAPQSSGGYYTQPSMQQNGPPMAGYYNTQYQQQQFASPPSGYGAPPPGAPQYASAPPPSGYYGQPQQYGAAPPPTPSPQQQPRYASQQYQQQPQQTTNGGPETPYGQQPPNYGQPWNQPPGGYPHQQPSPQQQYQQPPLPQQQQQTQYYGHPAQYSQQQPPQQLGGYYQQIPAAHQQQPPPQQSPAPQPYGIDGGSTFDSSGGNNKRPASRSSATGSSVGTSGPPTPNGGDKKPKRRKPSPVASAATPPTAGAAPLAANSNQVFRPPHPVGQQQTASSYGNNSQQNAYGAPPQPISYYGQPLPGLGHSYRQSPLPYQHQQPPGGSQQQSHLASHPQSSPYAHQQYQQGVPVQYGHLTPGSMGPPPGQTYATPPVVRGTKSPALDRSLSNTPSGPPPSASPKVGRKKGPPVVRASNDGEDGSPPASPRVEGKSCELGLKPLYDMGDEPGRRPWLDALGEHLDSIGRTLGKQPTVAKKPIDMYLLYEAVKLRGGFLQITKKRQLREVCDEIGFGNSSGTAAAVKKHYLRICLSYECLFDRSGADCKQMAREIDDSRARARCRKRPTARQKAKAAAEAAAAAAAGQPPTNSTNNTTSTDEDSVSYASMDGDEDEGSNSRSTGLLSRRASSNAIGFGAGSSSQMSSAESGVVANKHAGPGRPRKPRKKKLTKKELRAQEEAAAAAAAGTGGSVENVKAEPDTDSKSLAYHVEMQNRVLPANEFYGRQHVPPAAVTEAQRNPLLQQLVQPTPHQQHPAYAVQPQQPYPSNRTPTPRNFAPSPIPPSALQPQQSPLPVRPVNDTSSAPAPVGSVAWRQASSPDKRQPYQSMVPPRPSAAALSLIPSMPVPLGSDPTAVWPKNLPENCVENFKFTSSSVTKRVERIKLKRWIVDKQPIDMWKLTMSLRSGLLAESSWALDTLAICLADDMNNPYSSFQLSRLPRSLFDGIVEWFAVLLYYAFPEDFQHPMQSLKHSMMQMTVGSPTSTSTTPCGAGAIGRSITAKGVTTSVPNASIVRAAAEPNSKRARLPDGLPLKIVADGEISAKKPRLDFEAVDDTTTISDSDYFLLDEDPVPDVLRHYRPFVRTHHSCTRTTSLELFCGSDKLPTAASQSNRTRSRIDVDRTGNDAERVEKPKDMESVSVVAERSQSPDSGTAQSPGEHQMSTSEDDDSNAGKDAKNSNVKSASEAAAKHTHLKNMPSTEADDSVSKSRATYDCEANNFGDPIFNLASTSKAELQQRLLLTMLILRNLSFIPSNEAAMSRNATLLRFLGRLLLLHHTHSERRPLPTAPKTDAEWAREVLQEQSSMRAAAPPAQENDHDRERSAAAALVAQLREHAFVILSNCAGYMELIQLPEDVAEALVHGMLYWASTQCTAGDEPFPVIENSTNKRDQHPAASSAVAATESLAQRLERLVTPKRLAIECLGKLTANQSNIDLIIITPPFSNVAKLFQTVSDCIALGRQDCVLRELCICLLSAFSKTEDYVVNAIAKETPQVFGHVLSFIEQIEVAARMIAQTEKGLEVLKNQPALMGTSLQCLRRCGDILNEFIGKLDPDYHYIIFRQQDRILELLMSQVLEQQVANNLAKVMLRLKSPVDAFVAARRQREMLLDAVHVVQTPTSAGETPSTSSATGQTTLLSLLLQNKSDRNSSSVQTDAAVDAVADNAAADDSANNDAEKKNADDNIANAADDSFDTAATQLSTTSYGSAGMNGVYNVNDSVTDDLYHTDYADHHRDELQHPEAPDVDMVRPANNNDGHADNINGEVGHTSAREEPQSTTKNGDVEENQRTSPVSRFGYDSTDAAVTASDGFVGDGQTTRDENAADQLPSSDAEMPPPTYSPSQSTTTCSTAPLAVYADDGGFARQSPRQDSADQNGVAPDASDAVTATQESLALSD